MEIFVVVSIIILLIIYYKVFRIFDEVKKIKQLLEENKLN
jgi:hypothetical protein